LGHRVRTVYVYMDVFEMVCMARLQSGVYLDAVFGFLGPSVRPGAVGFMDLCTSGCWSVRFAPKSIKKWQYERWLTGYQKVTVKHAVR
jgi:hypothetical protein